MQLETNFIQPSRSRIQPMDAPPETLNISSFRTLPPLSTLPTHALPNQLSPSSLHQAPLPQISSVPTAQPYIVPVQAFTVPAQPEVRTAQLRDVQPRKPTKASPSCCNTHVTIAVTIISLALIGAAVGLIVVFVARPNPKTGTGDTNGCDGFSCTSETKCLSSSLRCDGISHCYDGEDEDDCDDEDECNGFYCTLGSIYANGCLPESWKCDGIPDCSDEEDEKDCEESPCSYSEIYCSGTCISSDHVCDRVNHCADGSDEEDCNDYCPDRYECPTGNIFGTFCISTSSVCDGIEHCNDGRDEDDCPDVSCSYNTTKCDENKCIPNYQICDGVNQCDDGEDEDDCDSYCPESFYCPSGTSWGVYCISSSWQCDGIHDCLDHSDEKDCSNLNCPGDDFHCVSGSVYGVCIPGYWKCDNIVDCHDSSDEKDCNEPTISTISPLNPMFTCPNHSGSAQIYQSQVCDGNEDCVGGRDEDACIISRDGGEEDIRVFSVKTLSHHGICSNGWTPAKSLAACNALGFKGFASMGTKITNETGLQSSEYSFDLNALVQKTPSVCVNQSVITLKCSGYNIIRRERREGKASSGIGTKIVGGEDVSINDYPWQVSIQSQSAGHWNHICGGTIVSKVHVITAAHCLESDTNYRIFAGSSELDSEGPDTVYSISKYTNHPLYSATTLIWDIACIKVKGSFSLSDSISPAYLPTAGQMFPDGTISHISGWGHLSSGGISPNKLQAVQLPMYNKYACKNIFPDFSNHIQTGMICAGLTNGGKDSCQGDSGGPLVVKTSSKAYVAGLVSFGFGCALPGYPGVYTEVSYGVDWIKRRME